MSDLHPAMSFRQPRFGFFPFGHQAIHQPDSFWRGRGKGKNQIGFSLKALRADLLSHGHHPGENDKRNVSPERAI
jgi:hypothetical protein